MHDLRSATITTLEIAEMMGIRHSDIVRRLEGRESKGKHIKGIIEILAERQMALSDFFTPSTYQDSSGKENKWDANFLPTSLLAKRALSLLQDMLRSFMKWSRQLVNSVQ